MFVFSFFSRELAEESLRDSDFRGLLGRGFQLGEEASVALKRVGPFFHFLPEQSSFHSGFLHFQCKWAVSVGGHMFLFLEEFRDFLGIRTSGGFSLLITPFHGPPGSSFAVLVCSFYLVVNSLQYRDVLSIPFNYYSKNEKKHFLNSSSDPPLGLQTSGLLLLLLGYS